MQYLIDRPPHFDRFAKSILGAGLLAVFGLGAAAPLLGGSVAVTPDSHEQQIKVVEAAPEKEWHFTLGAYSWLTAMEGSTELRGLKAQTDVSIGKELERLNLAYMSYMEVRYRRWSLGLDVIYAELSSDAPYQYGPISGDLNVKLKQAFITARLQYRLIDTDSYTLDVFGGVRWNYMESDIDIRTRVSFDQPFLQRFNGESEHRFDFSRDWFDPVIGMRNVLHMTPKWYLQASGDIGGFGVGSDLTWEAMGGIGYRFNTHVSTLVAFRAMGINYDKDDFKLNTVSYGPLLSVIFAF